MKGEIHGPARRQVRVSVLTAVLLCFWAVIHVLAGTPQWHHDLHPDAASAHHQCPITEFAGATFEPTSSPPETILPEQPVLVMAAWTHETPPSQRISHPQSARPPPAILPLFSPAGS